MSFSNRRVRGIGRVRRSVVAALIIATLVCPLSSSQAKVTGAHARRLVDSAVRLLRTSRNSTGATRPDSTTQAVGSPIERALQITHFRLCPRHLSMSVGENYTLVPVALDQAGEIVHGVAYGWQTSNAGVASVFGGTVEAVAPGLAVVTVSIGAALATVSVVVVPGTRRRLSDLEWDLEHANDCTNPEAVAVTEPDRNPPALSDSTIVQNNARLDNDARNQPTDLARLGKPAVMRPRDLIARLSVKPASASLARRSENAEPVALQGGGPGLIDGDGADTVASQATTYFNNAIGGPRFSPQETPMGNPTKTKNNLGS